MKKLLEVEVLKEEEAGTTIEVSGTGFNNRLRVDTRLLHEFEEECKNAECRARKAIMLKELPGIEEVISATNWSDNMLIKGKSIKESVSERNAMIDELVQEVVAQAKWTPRAEPYLWMLDLLKSKKK